MNLTTDQLSYILQRKYTNIRVGQDVLIVCSVGPMDQYRTYTELPDAYIIQWNLPHLSQPSDEALEALWIKLKEQYNSDPTRPDSDISKLLAKAKVNTQPIVSENPDI